jgi:hypothetical protein
VQIIAGLAAQGPSCTGENTYAGLGLGIDKDGKLALVGEFHYDSQKKRKAELEALVQRFFGAACQIAAQKIVAAYQGRQTEVVFDAQAKTLGLRVIC